MSKTKEYKVVLFSFGAVGKSSLVSRFICGHFPNWFSPTIEETDRKMIDINDSGSPVIIEITDTGGLDNFSHMKQFYIQNAEGFLLVYSIVDRESFSSIKPLRDEILKIKGSQLDVPILLVGNKCDLEGQRVVSTRDGQALATSWGVPFFETSAKEDLNTKRIFVEIVKEIIKANSGNRRNRSCILI